MASRLIILVVVAVAAVVVDVEYDVVVVAARLMMVVGAMFITAIKTTLKSGLETLFHSSTSFMGTNAKGRRSNSDDIGE